MEKTAKFQDLIMFIPDMFLYINSWDFHGFSHCHVQKRGTVTRFFWTPVDSYEVILIKAPSDFEYAH